MGMESIVSGRIELLSRMQDEIDKDKNFIRKLTHEKCYLSPDIFGLEGKTYYDSPIIPFGATYKAAEYRWDYFILEFEEILRNINFNTARLKLETEVEGTYDFFWVRKKGNDVFEESEKLIKTKDWYFGYGDRCRWGYLNTQSDEPVFKHEDFSYPVIKNT